MNLHTKSRLDTYQNRWIYEKLKHLILVNGGSNFELVMKFERFSQTTAWPEFVNSVLNFYVGTNGVLWSQCDVPSCALLDAKRDFCSIDDASQIEQ